MTIYGPTMSELKMIDLVFILFYFISSYVLLLIIRQGRQKCDTVTGHMTKSHKSHAHMT